VDRAYHHDLFHCHISTGIRRCKWWLGTTIRARRDTCNRKHHINSCATVWKRTSTWLRRGPSASWRTVSRKLTSLPLSKPAKRLAINAEQAAEHSSIAQTAAHRRRLQLAQRSQMHFEVQIGMNRPFQCRLIPSCN
jgi:hypothetical protein